MCEAMFKLTPPAPKPPVLTLPAPKPPVEIVALVLDTKDNALDDGDSWLDDVNLDLDKDGGFMLGGVDGDQVDSTWSPLCEGDFPSGGSSSEDHERVNDQK
ncbi:hypothetical protein TrLO_g9500 [Triparma laevis f. longispina]|uniref:Uncharacterized protein n=1 Tax=Triparma laevis f. longispina TaxID=1714387 RepID=A0A9W6ZBQ7_9STRA|nr:hypothetical protein TrLO_g9500 [Triparma laevis f. longispina]